MEGDEDGTAGPATGAARSRLSLTQPFPFEGCPPTTPEPATSPSLQRLVAALGAKVGGMAPTERNGLVRIVLNLTAAFSAFERWSVCLGIEWQLDALRQAVGLPPAPRVRGGRGGGAQQCPEMQALAVAACPAASAATHLPPWPAHVVHLPPCRPPTLSIWIMRRW